MVREFHPTPDGHPRRFPTVANRGFVFVPEAQQRSMAIRHPQFPRRSGDREPPGQAFHPLPPVEMPCGDRATELITRHLSIMSHPVQRNPQLRRRRFGGKSRFQSLHSLDDTLLALGGGMDLGDFIPCSQLMHRRPVDTQHLCNFGIWFVQVPADEFEPFRCRGALPLDFRVGLHELAVINRFSLPEFKHYSSAFWGSGGEPRQTLWTEVAKSPV